MTQSHSWGGELLTNSSEPEDSLPARVTILWRLPSSQRQVVPTIQIRVHRVSEKEDLHRPQRSGRIRDLNAGLPIHINHYTFPNPTGEIRMQKVVSITDLVLLPYSSDCPVYRESLAGLQKLSLHPGSLISCSHSSPGPGARLTRHCTIDFSFPLSKLALWFPIRPRGLHPPHPQQASPSKPPHSLIHLALTTHAFSYPPGQLPQNCPHQGLWLDA